MEWNWIGTWGWGGGVDDWDRDKTCEVFDALELDRAEIRKGEIWRMI